MSDWKDKLRRGMADYTEAPPEGLWASVQENIAPARRPSPLWWTLAGAAAALAAVLLVVRPAVETGQMQKDLLAVDGLSGAEESEYAAGPELASSELSGEAAPVRTQACSRSRGGKLAPAQNIVGSISAVEADDEPEPEAQMPEAAPAVEGNGDHAGKAGPGESVNGESVNGESVGDSNEPWIPSRQDIRLRRRPAPTVTLAMLAGGVPGGAVSSSMTEYGMSAGTRMVTKASALPSVAALARNKQVQTSSSHAVDMRAGIMFQIGLGEHWGLESGFLLSTLSCSSNSVTGNLKSTLNTKYNYVGVPLSAVWTPLRSGAFSLYAAAGPMIEYGYNCRWESAEYIADNRRSCDYGSYVPRDLAFSAGLNAGAQLALERYGSLFLQPGVSWYFAHTGVRETYYTEHPLVFTLTGGFRFSF